MITFDISSSITFFLPSFSERELGPTAPHRPRVTCFFFSSSTRLGALRPSSSRSHMLASFSPSSSLFSLTKSLTCKVWLGFLPFPDCFWLGACAAPSPKQSRKRLPGRISYIAEGFGAVPRACLKFLATQVELAWVCINIDILSWIAAQINSLRWEWV